MRVLALRLACVALVQLFGAGPAAASPFTVHETFVASSPIQPSGLAWLAGEEVLFSFTFDPATPDTDDRPQYGQYTGGLLGVSIEFLASGIEFAFGGGASDEVRTAYHIPCSGQTLCLRYYADSLFFDSTTPISTAGTDLEPFAFHAEFYSAHPVDLLASEAVPDHRFPFEEASIWLDDAEFSTLLSFRALDVAEPVELTFGALIGVGLLAARRRRPGGEHAIVRPAS